ncbi:MAG: trypsin-like peptidase domain-containing protein [Alphaproteobacteria bacterium]|nr:trypsin-like peptidase domain-containing protein [Alphaproteobacteria bacterium]
MPDSITYLDLLGSRTASAANPGTGLVGRDIIIVPPQHRELDTDRARDLLENLSANRVLDRIARDFKENLIKSAKSALTKLSQEAEAALLGENEKLALEAIVIAQGIRPVVNFEGGHLDYTNADLGSWAQFTKSDAGIIETVARSVGRINLDGRQVGTGFVVSDREIMTNRHVLAAIGLETDGVWRVRKGANISFADDGNGSEGLKLAHHGASTGNAKAATGVDFGQFDYAIIPVETRFFAPKFPAPLVLEETRSNVIFDRPVYVLGYPGRPQAGTERFSLLKDLFESKYGTKRYCPGRISASFSDVQSDPLNTVFGHDCTTLGGNSGSPVIDLGDGSACVIGIHFAGARRISNYAHSMAALQNKFNNDRLVFI